MNKPTKDEILNMRAGNEMDDLVMKYVMGSYIPFFHPSIQIKDAFAVVEHMACRGYCFVLDYDLCAWTAKFINAETGKTVSVNTTSDNASAEICRAALLAAMEMKNE